MITTTIIGSIRVKPLRFSAMYGLWAWSSTIISSISVYPLFFIAATRPSTAPLERNRRAQGQVCRSSFRK